MTYVYTRMIHPTRDALSEWSRDELRHYAKRLRVKRGRSKEDTISNLIESGKVKILATLSMELT